MSFCEDHTTRDEFFLNLKVLNYDKSKKWGKGYVLSRTMFDTLDITVIQSVIIFVFHCIDPDRAKRKFSAYWPITNNTRMFAEFRKLIKEWIKEITNEPEIEYARCYNLAGLPILSGSKLYTFLVALSTYAIRISLKNSPILGIGANSELINSLTERNEKHILEHKEFVGGWTDFYNDLDLKNTQLQKEIHEMETRKTQLEPSDIDIEWLSEVLRDLSTNIQSYSTRISSSSHSVKQVDFPSSEVIKSLCELDRTIYEDLESRKFVGPQFNKLKPRMYDLIERVKRLYKDRLPDTSGFVPLEFPVVENVSLLGEIERGRSCIRKFDDIVSSARESVFAERFG